MFRLIKSALFIFLIFASQYSYADFDATYLNLPVLVNQSPGPDFFWGTADDEDLAALFPAEVGLNTLGAASYSVNVNGDRSYNGSGTVSTNFVNGVTMPGEAYQGTTQLFGTEFQGIQDGVVTTTQRASNPNGTITSFFSQLLTYNVTNVDTLGNTISAAANASTWINNGDDPVAIFGAGDLATNFTFLMNAMNAAGITWGSLFYEVGNFNVIAGPNAGLTGTYANAYFSVTPVTFGGANATILNLPVFVNQSPGPDFLWGSADDENDLAGLFPGVLGLNTIGGAGFTIDANGGRSYAGIGTLSGNADTLNPLGTFGVATQGITLSNSIEFQGFLNGVVGSQSRSSNPNGTITYLADHTYSYSFTNVSSVGDTIAATSNTSWWINNGENPVTIFGAGDLANNFNFLISALNNANITWGGLGFELGQFNITAGPNAGLTGNYSFASYQEKHFGPAEIASPIANATLTDGNLAVTWNSNSTIATRWAVRAGSGGSGTFDLAAPPLLGASATSDSLTGLPVDGRTITIDLYAETNGAFSIVDTVNVTAFTAPSPALLTPAGGSTLASGTVNVSWDPMGTAATRWAVRAGSGGSGTFDLAAPPLLGAGATSQMVTGLPVDGSAITIDLYAEVNGAFTIVDTVNVTAFTAPPPQLLTPADASTLTSETVFVSWDAMGDTTVTRWAVRAGSGGSGTFDLAAPPLAPAISNGQTLMGLPTDGSAITIDLYAEVNGVFSIVDTVNVTAHTALTPQITAPADALTLASGTVNVTWDQMGTAATRWAVRAGSGGSGTFDLAAPPLLGAGATSQTVTGLPVDGSAITIDLYAEVNGAFSIVDTVNVTAFTAPLPQLITPADASILTSGTVTVGWNQMGTAVTRWAVRAGSGGSGTFDLAAPPLLGAGAFNQQVTGLPVDGSAITIDLYAEINGVFSIVDTVNVTAFTAPPPATPQLLFPTDAATLTTGAVNVTWDQMNTPATRWAVRAGSGGSGTFDLAAPALLGAGATSQMVTGLPVDGSAITIDLYAEVNGAFSIVDTVNVTAFTAPSPAITAPADASTLASGTVNVTWDQMGTAATRWAVRAGSGGSGTFDLAAPPLLGSGATSQIITRLPTDGSAITIDLYAEVNGAFSIVDTVNVTAFTAPAPQITAPIDGVTLTNSVATVTWDQMGNTVTRWAVRAGSGGSGTFDIAAPPLLDEDATSQMITGLPADGSAFTIDLYAEIGGTFVIVDTITVTAFTGPKFTSPANNATLNSGTVTMNWNSMGNTVSRYAVRAGSGGSGTFDIAAPPLVGSSVTSQTVFSLPINGNAYTIDLYAEIDGVFSIVDTLNVTAPNLISGNYFVLGSFVQTGCQDSSDNFNFTTSGSYTATRQNSVNFTGQVSFDTLEGIPLSSVSIIIDSSLIGVHASRSASGSSTISVTADGEFAAAQGDFTANFTEGGVALSISAVDPADSCAIAISLDGPR